MSAALRILSPAIAPAPAAEPPAPRPLGLAAELTYRCPLHCPYCSNPVDYPAGSELTASEWTRVFQEAGGLGVMHALLTGGEPLARGDIADLVAAARAAGLYTNLITSAIGLTRQRLEQLKRAGLDSVQISFQSDESTLADPIAGTAAHALKLDAARHVRALEMPLTVNVVLHRGNIHRIEQIIAFAETLGAGRLELANVQFYGWAFRNRAPLLPQRSQIDRAARIASAASQRLRGTMDVLYVMPDYFGDRPKPCMNGWGRRYLTVNPVGDVLPCPTAYEIPGMHFDNVREHDLAWIWQRSHAFNRFRGTDWMPEPCQSCDRREVDFGGCRCQAALLTGDAASTDPACALSPHHATLRQWVDRSDDGQFPAPVQIQMRRNPQTSGHTL